LKWNVIEQVGHVECGRREFETDELRFHFNMKDLPEVPDVLLLSNVLAYLPCPQETLKELLSYGCNHLLIDETPFIVGEGDRLTVQKVPEYIYKASYPAWFFNETKTLKTIESFGYHLITDFDCKYSYSPDGAVGYYKGFIYDKRQTELESTTISEKTSPGNP
jgi:putative methyltransferase (TIGR04325 family)